jgi:hypothetical protein
MSTVDVDQIKSLLIGGLEELVGEVREDAAKFLTDLSTEIATTVERAAAGDLAARQALEHLREQVYTRAYIVRLRSQGVVVQNFGYLVGVVIRVLAKALA